MRFFWTSFLTLLLQTAVSAVEIGEAHIYIFNLESSPYPNVSVESGEVSTMTDESGFAALELPIGEQRVFLSIGGKVVSEFNVNILPAEITEAVLTLGETSAKQDVEVISEEEEAESVAAEDLEVGDKSGFLTGVVVDSKSGDPIADARVFVRGVNAESKTDANGMFSAELPIGEYAVSIIHPEYTSSTLEGLIVEEDKTLEVKSELLPTAVELEGISVVAVKITAVCSNRVKKEVQKTSRDHWF